MFDFDRGYMNLCEFGLRFLLFRCYNKRKNVFRCDFLFLRMTEDVGRATFEIQRDVVI